jgi:hypothetical protein
VKPQELTRFSNAAWNRIPRLIHSNDGDLFCSFKHIVIAIYIRNPRRCYRPDSIFNHPHAETVE